MGVDVFLYLFDRQKCQNAVLPAYRFFSETLDTEPLVNLMERAVNNNEGPEESVESSESFSQYIEILRNYRVPSATTVEGVETTCQLRRIIDNEVVPRLVRRFCMPQSGVLNPEQNMSHRALMHYLYSRSRWIEDYFTFAKEPSGPQPEIKIGEWSTFFSKEEVQAFASELSMMSSPDDPEVLADGFDNLRLLVSAAAQNPQLSLLLATL